MKILLFSDAFPPFQSSASIQLKDLINQFIQDGHEITVFTTSKIDSPSNFLEIDDRVRVVRINNPRTKNVNFFRRGFAEMVIPITTLVSFYKSKFKNETFDGIVWYSPTIFFGVPIYILKKKLRCQSYLILRDIFPEWALNVGHLKKGPVYYFFKFFEIIQYRSADIIGIQSKSNFAYFKKKHRNQLHKIEVLNNWLGEMKHKPSKVNIAETKLHGRQIGIYAGNIGSAQKLEAIINLVFELQNNDEIGFVFIGDGDAKIKLEKMAKNKGCKNILFFEPVSHDELSYIYAQCDFGIISLDPKHQTHNIPGKLLSYLINGLSIFALVNKDNDMIELNENYNFGFITSDTDLDNIKKNFLEFIDKLKNDNNSHARSKEVAKKLFSSSSASNQIISHFLN